MSNDQLRHIIKALSYHIITGNIFQGRKTFTDPVYGKCAFYKENFHEILDQSYKWVWCTQTFMEKFFTGYSQTMKFVKVFSLDLSNGLTYEQKTKTARQIRKGPCSKPLNQANRFSTYLLVCACCSTAVLAIKLNFGNLRILHLFTLSGVLLTPCCNLISTVNKCYFFRTLPMAEYCTSLFN